MKVAKLTITDGETAKTNLHHPGITQPWDISLCGQDLMGDKIGSESWPAATPVEGKIDCPDCLAIITACRALRRRDFISAAAPDLLAENERLRADIETWEEHSRVLTEVCKELTSAKIQQENENKRLREALEEIIKVCEESQFIALPEKIEAIARPALNEQK